jgi:hypothetical protein
MTSLHPELQYITDIGQRLGIESKLVVHSISTITCAEKAQLLGWDVSRVVKALYFHTGDYNDEMIGIITPEFGNIDFKKIISETLRMDVKRAKRYFSNGYMPTGMSKGTCSPFPRESVMGKEVSDLIIIDYPELDEIVVDISIGDDVSEPFKTSMHIPYRGIHSILREKFGERIYKIK